ncbi:enoyl-CoA hydratase/isomerase [Cordyceps militaris CM01]|uniref:Enoyl-CoA hydratase/isomerase n=1 Tax=Cordyceps militaris (strain CM01) TaxID=983644 RepID=G3JPE3_CORMM|nr:enoyl-CoA hydratase/isomerase [Cordyceps militaris CM01]EGX89753.1 enoyl-CoA hydratase/isomerase [Cordyceps militaris CM01]
MAAEIVIPVSYVTSAESEIRVTNYPEAAGGVTPILIATLNRPKKLNAITGGMITDLIDLFEAVNVDDRVKAVVVTGAGKAFSAGIDLSMDTSGLNDGAVGEMRDPGGTLALAMFNCSKPVIVAYNGLSVGIGMTSTLAAAIRIAPRTGAEFGFPFARIGLTMESCSSFFLPRMVGYSNATYLLTTGKRYPADSSVLSGVFAELVDTPQDVLPRALALAEDIITNVSPMAAYLNRQLIWRNAGSAEGAHLVDSPLLYDMFAGRYVSLPLAFLLGILRQSTFAENCLHKLSDHLAFKSSFFNKRKPEYSATLAKDAPRTYPWWKELSIRLQPKAKVEDKNNSRL